MRHTTWSSRGLRPHQRGLRFSVMVPVFASMDVTTNGPLDGTALLRNPLLKALGLLERSAGRRG